MKTAKIGPAQFVLFVFFPFSNDFNEAEYCGFHPEGDTDDVFCDIKEWPSPFHLLDYLGQ